MDNENEELVNRAYREAMTVNICQLLYDYDFDCSLFSVISSYGERKCSLQPSEPAERKSYR